MNGARFVISVWIGCWVWAASVGARAAQTVSQPPYDVTITDTARGNRLQISGPRLPKATVFEAVNGAETLVAKPAYFEIPSVQVPLVATVWLTGVHTYQLRVFNPQTGKIAIDESTETMPRLGVDGADLWFEIGLPISPRAKPGEENETLCQLWNPKRGIRPCESEKAQLY